MTGLGISAHRDAMPIIRMQPDVQNQGYAAGWAAAMAANAGVAPRHIDVDALQTHLVDKGILPASMLSDEDSYPFSSNELQAAVASIGTSNTYPGLRVVMAQWDDSLPMMRAAYSAASGDAARRYAVVLGMMGDPIGVSNLIATVESYAAWDEGWNFTGMGQSNEALSPLDSCIIALGRTGDRNAMSCLLAKAALLTASSEFSHFRAMSLAFEALGDPAGAVALHAMLQFPGMMGMRAQTPLPAAETGTTA